MNALDRYHAATEAWREATGARERAARQRAYAVADMAAAWGAEEAARRTGLSPSRVEQMIQRAKETP